MGYCSFFENSDNNVEICQNITLYTLNIHNFICQKFLEIKIQKETEEDNPIKNGQQT